MKTRCINLTVAVVAFLALAITGCKKASTSTTDSSISAQDNTTVSNAMDANSNDAVAAAGQVNGFSGKAESWWNKSVLCGASIVDTGNGHLINITYDGSTECQGIIRSGSMTVSLTGGNHWRDAGATLMLTLNNLKVTNVETGYSYTLNGTHSVVNETGGLAWQILAGLTTNTTITQRTRTNNLTVTFADGTTRSWNLDRSVSWTSSMQGGMDLVTVSIFSENAGQVALWGNDRYGNAFTLAIPVNVDANNHNLLCLFKPYQGKYVTQYKNETVTVTFGTDKNGNIVGNSTTCSEGYLITYTENGKTVTKFVGYWL